MTSNLEEELKLNGLIKYSLTPPTWQLPLLLLPPNSTSTTTPSTPIYAEFYPTKPNQIENDLSESNVKSGYTSKSIVINEVFSAHQLIYEKLKGDDILIALSNLTNQVLNQQSKPDLPTSSFRLPSRVTLNEQKRESWINDLANPTVPLEKLSRNIPHGYKGEKLLEMLYERQVTIERAVWYIRAIGAIEIQTQKQRSGFNLNQYTAECSATTFEFLRQQLEAITLAPVISQMSSAQDKGKGKAINQDVVSEPTLREKWITKFIYTRRLIAALYSENLLDHFGWLKFLIGQIESSHFGQLSFILLLVNDYLPDYIISEPLATALVAASFSRVIEIDGCEDLATTDSLVSSLAAIIRYSFCSLPSAFVALSARLSHASRLEALLFALAPRSTALTPTTSSTSTKAIEEREKEEVIMMLQRSMRMEWNEITSRDAISTELGFDKGSSEPEELEIITILDKITFPHALTATHRLLFHSRRQPLRKVSSSLLATLLTWSITADRFGLSRIYAVASLLSIELATEPSTTSKDRRAEYLNGFIKWIDDDRVRLMESGAREGIEQRRLLLAELIGRGVIEYAFYLQRMIARGETETRGTKSRGSVHLELLRTVALHHESENLLIKRRIALRTPVVDREEMTRLSEAVVNGLASVLPELVEVSGPSIGSSEIDAVNFFTLLRALAATGSHLDVTRSVIPTALSTMLSSYPKRELSCETFSVMYHIYVTVNDFAGLFEILLILLCSHPSRSLLSSILDVVSLYNTTFTSLDGLPRLAKALFVTFTAFEEEAIHDRRLFGLLRRLGDEGWFGVEERQVVESAGGRLINSLTTGPLQSLPLPSSTPLIELRSTLLALDCDAPTIVNLATTIWYRYHTHTNWGQRTLDTCFRTVLIEGGETGTERVGAFLREINERLVGGVEGELEGWITSLSNDDVLRLWSRKEDGGRGEQVGEVVRALVEDGVVSGAGVVKYVIVACWHGIIALRGDDERERRERMGACGNLVRLLGSLIGDEDQAIDSISVEALRTNQRIMTRRSELFGTGEIREMGRVLRSIVVLLELFDASPTHEEATGSTTSLMGEKEDTRRVELTIELNGLFSRICASQEFKAMIVSDPEALAEAMLDDVISLPLRDESKSNVAKLRRRILAGLLFALKDNTNLGTPANLISTQDWDRFLAGLTVWRLAISKVEVSACLEGLDLNEMSPTTGVVGVVQSEMVEALKTLSSHFLDRVGEGEGATWLGEQIVRCYHGKASDELVSVAFTRIASALDQLVLADESSDVALTTLRSTGRLLNTLLESSRASSRTEPLQQLLVSIKSTLNKALQYTGEFDRVKQMMLFSAHFIKIALRCTSLGANDGSNEALRDCLSPLAGLAIIAASITPLDSTLPTLLLDTCSRILHHLDRSASSTLPSLHSILTPSPSYILPDLILARLTSLFTSSIRPEPVILGWSLVDHSDPSPKPTLLLPGSSSSSSATTTTVKTNHSPLDLHLFSPKIIAIIPPLTALDAIPRSRSLPLGSTIERGRQTNFDSEVSCVGIPLAARSFRRTMNSYVKSSWDPNKRVEMNIVDDTQENAKEKEKEKSKEKQHHKEKERVVTGRKSSSPVVIAPTQTRRRSNRSNSMTKSTTGGSGSKKSQEVIIVSDDDDDDDAREEAEEEYEEEESEAEIIPVPKKRGRPALAMKSVRGGGGGGTMTSRKKPKTG